MLKRFSVLLAFFFLALFFNSCGSNNSSTAPENSLKGNIDSPDSKDSKQDTTSTLGPTEHPKADIARIKSGKGYKIYSPNTTASKTISWAIPGTKDMFSLDMLDAINDILVSEGKDYLLQIISIEDEYYSPETYKKIINDYERENGPVDILNDYSGMIQLDVGEYIKEDYYENLDSYLENDENKAFYNSFDRNEWIAASVNGENYLVPTHSGLEPENIMYFYFNKDLLSDISGFKGTLGEVIELYELYGDGKTIVIDVLNYMNSLMGKEFWNGLIFDSSENIFKDTLKDQSVTANITKLCSLKIRSDINKVDMNDVFMVLTIRDEKLDTDNFLKFELPINDRWDKKMLYCNGIRKISEKKDEAFDFIKTVYLNSSIADILIYGAPIYDFDYEDDKVVLKKDISEDLSYMMRQLVFGTYYFSKPLKDETPDRKTQYENIVKNKKDNKVLGFFPDLSKEETELLAVYSNFINYNYMMNFDGNEPTDAVPENTLGITNSAELSRRIEPLIERLNTEVINYLK